MKLAFWRRAPGRHALGAAVTSIPGMPGVGTPAPPVAAPVLAPPAFAPPAVVTDPLPAAPALPVWSEPVPEPNLHVAGPRIELGFRDGSRASLDPSSEQARALEDIAAVLTRKD